MLLEELTKEQRKELLQLLVSELREDAKNPKEEMIRGVKGLLRSDAPVMCPEMCFRFQEQGTCVHLSKEPVIKPTFTKAYELMIQEKKDKKVKTHKDAENPKAGWVCVEDWKKTPYNYGVYVWVDAQDKLLHVAKAMDIRRRHFTWVTTKDPRFIPVAKIWCLHTGWYNELLEALSVVPLGSVITLKLLESVLALARPIDLMLPEPPVG